MQPAAGASASRLCLVRRIDLQPAASSRFDPRLQADCEAPSQTRGSRSSATTARSRTKISLRSLAAQDLQTQVIVRPYAHDAELSALYGRARAFALLSEYEGFGHPPLEALACGVPSVLLDTDVAREVCR